MNVRITHTRYENFFKKIIYLLTTKVSLLFAVYFKKSDMSMSTECNNNYTRMIKSLFFHIKLNME